MHLTWYPENKCKNSLEGRFPLFQKYPWMGKLDYIVNRTQDFKGRRVPFNSPKSNDFLLTIGSPLHMRSQRNLKSPAITLIRLLYSSGWLCNYNYAVGQSGQAALVYNGNVTRHFQRKMFERVKWSRERPCVHRWLSLTIKVHTLKTWWTLRTCHATAQCKSQQ